LKVFANEAIFLCALVHDRHIPALCFSGSSVKLVYISTATEQDHREERTEPKLFMIV